MAPTKQAQQDKEDISQLRKPIILHGKPVEQILNSIHYGSPELQSLLLDECDMIFECKVCRALFRDLPNFIAHKRRYCCQSASEKNYLSIADLPNERLVVVHPEPVHSSGTTGDSSQTPSSSQPRLEDTLQRLRSGEAGNSHAFRVYSDAADKLQHQKDHTKITSLRTRNIPTNSNAIFIDVTTTSVNIHDRPSTSTSCGKNNKSSDPKPCEKRKANLRSNSSNRSSDNLEDLNVRLLRELKGIQNKAKSKPPNQKAAKVNQTQQVGEVKSVGKNHVVKSRPRVDVDDIEGVQLSVRDDCGNPSDTMLKTKNDSCPVKSRTHTEKSEETKLLVPNNNIRYLTDNKKFGSASLVRNDKLKSKPSVDHEKVLTKTNSPKTTAMKWDEKTQMKTGIDGYKSQVCTDDEQPERKSPRKNGWSRAKDYDEAGLIEVTRQNPRSVLLKCQNTEEQCKDDPPSKSSNNSEVLINAEDLNRSKTSLVCASCGLIFSSRKSLLFHINMHHAVKRTFYPCPYCSNLYYYIAAVQRHIRINHKRSKKEAAQMWYDIKKKSFSKVVPPNESLLKVKQNIAGARRSSRYSATSCLNKKLNSNPYIYSSLTSSRRKELLVKKHLALKENNEAHFEAIVTSVSPGESEDKKELETTSISLPDDSSFQTKETIFDCQEGLKREQNILHKTKVPSTVKPSTGHRIDREMTSCHKCSRLFGRKTTLEKHIKTCEGRLPVTSISIPQDLSSTMPKDSDNDNSSLGIAKKVQEAMNIDIAQSSTAPGDALQMSSKQTSDSSNKDEVDSSDKSKVSVVGVRRKTRQGNDKEVHLPFVSLESISFSDKSMSNFKVKAEQMKQSLKVEKQSTASTSNKKHSSTSLDSEEIKVPHNDRVTYVDNTVLMNTLTKLKSSVDLNTSNVKFEDDSKSSLVQSGQVPVLVNNNSECAVEMSECGDKTIHVNLDSKEEFIPESDGDSKPGDIKLSNVMERPRRKRKIPSRNIGAVEFFKKIHRLDLDKNEPLSKKIKSSVTSNAAALNNQQIIRGKSNGNEMVNVNGKEVGNDMSRKRRNATRVFVLNSNNAGVKSKSKLRCYNHNKVENFVDTTNRCCLKCGATFTNLNNLKRHIVRLHLKWSRFKCKLCNFSCFDKSECNTHIVRSHRGETKPARNRFSSLIDDLTEKGSRAMSLKKCESLKAKSRQQASDENIYKNQNAQKIPRLPERKPETSTTILPTDDKGVEDNGSPLTMCSSLSEDIDATAEGNGCKNAPQVAEKIQSGDTQLMVSSEISLVTDKLTLSENQTATNRGSNSSGDNSNIPSVNVKRPTLPFNISTRNSPRVFDTTPYSRVETETSLTVEKTQPTPIVPANEVVLHTRHGVYAKTLPTVLNKGPTPSITDIQEAVDAEVETQTENPSAKSTTTQNVNPSAGEKISVGSEDIEEGDTDAVALSYTDSL